MYTYNEKGEKIPVQMKMSRGAVQENFSLSGKNGKILLWVLGGVAFVVVVALFVSMNRKSKSGGGVDSPSPSTAASMGMCGGGKARMGKQRFGFRFY